MRETENNPLISIICNTYNQEKYIGRTLEGFFSQNTSYSFEILLHDDASTDRTPEIVSTYEKKYPGVILPIYESENQYSKGIYQTSYVFGFPRVRGKYVAFCEGDDYWTDPLKLEKQVSYLETHEECAMCIHAIQDVTEDGSPIAEFHPFPETGVRREEDVLKSYRVMPFASLVCRAEYLKDLPEFYTQCSVGDLPITLYLAHRGTVFYLDEVMACYRNGSAGSWTNSLWEGEYKERLVRHLNEMKEMYTSFDRYTEYRYHEAVEYAIGQEDYQMALGCEDYRTVIAPANACYFKKMSLRARIGARIGAVHPGLLRWLQKIGHRQ